MLESFHFSNECIHFNRRVRSARCYLLTLDSPRTAYELRCHVAELNYKDSLMMKVRRIQKIKIRFPISEMFLDALSVVLIQITMNSRFIFCEIGWEVMEFLFNIERNLFIIIFNRNSFRIRIS